MTPTPTPLPDNAISPDLDRAAWLKARQSGIGSSEAAAAIGLSPWQSPRALYMRKTEPHFGEYEPSEAMRWGLRLEPVIADAYAEETGATFAHAQPFFRSAAYPFMLATLDRMRTNGRVVELKAVGPRQASQWGAAGSDEIPQWYAVQVLHQLAVTGSEVADVAALICGQELRIYTLERDQEAIDAMVEMEAAFWSRIERRDPPPLEPERDLPLLTRIFPGAEGTIDFGAELTESVEEWDVVREHIGTLEALKKRKQAEILAAFGGAAAARLQNGRVLTRRIVRVAERIQTVKAFEYARLAWEKEGGNG